MKFLPVLLILVISDNKLFSQDIVFKKSDLRIDEPFKKGGIKRDTFNIQVKAQNLPTGNINVKIQRLKESTYPDSLIQIITPTIPKLASDNTIKISIATDVWSDNEEYIILTANWEIDGEQRQVKDTLFVKNTYPFKGTIAQDYTDWNDGKRAEIFIGSNFDFINSKVTLSDWYGGVRLFLPSITDLRYNSGKTNRTPRWGISGGVYHAKSLSNFGNPTSDDPTKNVYSRVTQYVADSVVVRYDTVNTKTSTEINNWGMYFAPIYQYSRFESSDGKFITNLYIGLHTEAIRRNVSTTYTFDSLGFTTQKYKTSQLPRSSTLGMPAKVVQTFYDAYYGICLPIQFLWKDILDIKINPCFGAGSRGYSSQVTRGDLLIKSSPFFYLAQFDLLARLGGIRLNIGGEIRGYFPNENPIMTAYLGTSFSIQKLVDFVTK